MFRRLIPAFAFAIATVAMCLTSAEQANAQCYGGGRGVSVGFSSFGGGFSPGFNSFGGGFNNFNTFNRGFGSSSFYRPVYYGGGFNNFNSFGGGFNRSFRPSFNSFGRSCGY